MFKCEAHLSDYLLRRSVCLLASIHQPFSWCCPAHIINLAKMTFSQTTDHRPQTIETSCFYSRSRGEQKTQKTSLLAGILQPISEDGVLTTQEKQQWFVRPNVTASGEQEGGLPLLWRWIISISVCPWHHAVPLGMQNIYKGDISF